MDEKTNTSSGETKARSRTDSENWRLIMAIDILLDYIMQLEKESLEGDENVEAVIPEAEKSVL